jgi:hypothetical protein
MSTITKLNPSGSSNGQPIAVAATASPGTTFHVASSTAGVQDEIYMYLTNTDSVEHEATVQFGGTGANDNIKFPVPANDTILAIAGVPVTGGVTVAVFADSASKLNAFGYVNRIS